LVLARPPSLGFELSFYDHALGLFISPTFLEPPRVAGIQSWVGLFFLPLSRLRFSQLEGLRRVTCLGGSSDVLDELANGDVLTESDPVVLR